MNILGRHSIRKTLQFVLLSASCSALLLATVGFAVHDWFSSKAQMFDQLRSEAGIIGSNSVAALVFDDVNSATKTLLSLEGEENIVGAVLFDASGAAFARYERASHDFPQASPDGPQGALDGYLYVQLPIMFDGDAVGSILVLSDNRNWREKQWLRLGIVFGLFLISLLLAVMISNRLQRLVTDPVLRLAGTARRITESRDYSLRADKLSKDEIGLLVDDFNEMLHQIQLRDDEVRQVHDQLEEKVDERTRELAELASKFEHQACHDTLTGLANRMTFDNRLQYAVSQAKRHGGRVSILFLDLDRFKVINDTLGHGIGDRLLMQVSERLRVCLRESDTLARLGGDEFAILLMDVDPDGAGEVGTKAIYAISEPMQIDGHHLHLTASVGISLFPGDGGDAATLLRNADTAMYRSKDQGRNRLTFFAQEMNERVERRLVLENKLRQAIIDSKLYLHYQPKWDCHSLKVVGVEALLRWDDEDEGTVSPTEFIPLAEECGLIGAIDLWVLEAACRELLSLYEGADPEIQLSVNFSPLHFARPDIFEDVAQALETTGFPGNRLELEITESVIGPDVEDAYKQLRAIRDLGVEISIDDFGTAYSSLSRLKQMPLNTLKIDRSFIQDLGRDVDDETLVRTIITMAHNLNLKVVAEGVETQEQYQFVKQYNCDTVQGYLYGKPVSIQDLAVMIHSE